MEENKRGVRSFQTLGKAVRKDMPLCGVTENMLLNRVEYKNRTHKGNP